MAKSKIPSPLERRHVVEKDLNVKNAMEIADAYIADGRSFEAIDFLSKVEATDRLNELRDLAIESGDAFLFQAIVRAGGEEPDKEAWSRLAEAADAAGKERYADVARRQLGRLEE